jgi:hypothetical protein
MQSNIKLVKLSILKNIQSHLVEQKNRIRPKFQTSFTDHNLTRLNIQKLLQKTTEQKGIYEAKIAFNNRSVRLTKVNLQKALNYGYKTVTALYTTRKIKVL